MQIIRKLLLTALVTALVLSIGASISSALRSIGIEREERLTLTGRLTFTGGGGEFNCNVTLVKTVARSIAKMGTIAMGRVTEIRFQEPNECRFAAFTEVNSIIPENINVGEHWKIFYRQFLGTLPRITGLLVTVRNTTLRLEFGIRNMAQRCVYENRRVGTIGILAPVDAEGILGILRTLNRGEEATRQTELVILEGECPLTAEIKLELTPSQNTRVRLL